MADYNYTQRFKQITEQMAELYQKKNADYGNSFADSVEEWGLVAGATRLSDKFNRMKQMIKHPDQQQVKTESLYDTCIDGACYFIMLAMEIEKGEKKPKPVVHTNPIDPIDIDPSFYINPHMPNYPTPTITCSASIDQLDYPKDGEPR